jgi:hypothetical protein
VSVDQPRHHRRRIEAACEVDAELEHLHPHSPAAFDVQPGLGDEQALRKRNRGRAGPLKSELEECRAGFRTPAWVDGVTWRSTGSKNRRKFSWSRISTYSRKAASIASGVRGCGIV